MPTPWRAHHPRSQRRASPCADRPPPRPVTGPPGRGDLRLPATRPRQRGGIIAGALALPRAGLPSPLMRPDQVRPNPCPKESTPSRRGSGATLTRRGVGADAAVAMARPVMSRLAWRRPVASQQPDDVGWHPSHASAWMLGIGHPKRLLSRSLSSPPCGVDGTQPKQDRPSTSWSALASDGPVDGSIWAAERWTTCDLSLRSRRAPPCPHGDLQRTCRPSDDRPRPLRLLSIGCWQRYRPGVVTAASVGREEDSQRLPARRVCGRHAGHLAADHRAPGPGRRSGGRHLAERALAHDRLMPEIRTGSVAAIAVPARPRYPASQLGDPLGRCFT